jgi:hypothetical protein
LEEAIPYLSEDTGSSLFSEIIKGSDRSYGSYILAGLRTSLADHFKRRPLKTHIYRGMIKSLYGLARALYAFDSASKHIIAR